MGVLTALTLSALLFFGPSTKAYLSDFQVSLEGQRVVVNFELVDGFTDDLFERIQTGLPSGFIFEFVLVRDQKRLPDNKIAKSQLEVIAMFNAVTREYLVNYKQDGKLIDSRIARDRDELESAMTQYEGLTVFHIDQISPDKRLVVRARAELGSKTTLLIIPSSITTDWSRSRVFHAP
jgi:hypothetical protein